ncbi:MAG TPA: RNA polymerase sigma factor, partial [Chitinophagaceae bacterium]|nr:RNA polymerase sigma factor [Chitinophagaceae bacterium]
MYNTSLRITGNSADAEDILQESFIDAFEQLQSFEGRSTFGAWLKQIVVYKSIGLLRKKRIIFTELIIEAEDLAEEDSAGENEIDYTVAAIKEAIAGLPDGYRAVLSLYLVEGYDHEEISEILSISHSTVRTQYIRGKQKLLQLLTKAKQHE